MVEGATMKNKKNKHQIYISIVLYLKNDQEVIQSTLKDLYSYCDTTFSNFELIIVNNNSNDTSASKIEEICKKDEKLAKKTTVIHLAADHTLESAMKVGTGFSIGDYVLEIDHLPVQFDYSYIEELYLKAGSGFDLVALVPEKESGFGSKFFYYLLKHHSNIKVDLRTEVARLVTRRLLNKTSKIRDKISYRKIIYRIVGLPFSSIVIKSSKTYRSRLNFQQRWQLAADIIFVFTNLGLRASMVLSVLFTLISIVLGFYVLWQFGTNPNLVEGWTTTMSFLSLGFTGVFLLLTILIKYISLILGEITTLPEYSIGAIRKMSNEL